MATRRVEDEEVVQGPPPRPPWWREFWILLALLALAGLAVLLWWLLLRDDNGGKTTMPNVIGLQEQVAVERIEAADLQANVEGEPSDQPEGQVISQDPGAGVQLDEGEEVVIGVSRGGGTTTVTETETVVETETTTDTTATGTATPTVETTPTQAAVPAVVGQSYRDAVAAIVSAGLLASSYPVSSPEPRGTVVAQRPAEGTTVSSDQPVRLNVSRGPNPAGTTPVPDLTGPAVREALSRCAQANVTCRITFSAAPSPEEVGEVVDQRPAARTSVPILSQVQLFVGR